MTPPDWTLSLFGFAACVLGFAIVASVEDAPAEPCAVSAVATPRCVVTGDRNDCPHPPPEVSVLAPGAEKISVTYVRSDAPFTCCSSGVTVSNCRVSEHVDEAEHERHQLYLPLGDVGCQGTKAKQILFVERR